MSIRLIPSPVYDTTVIYNIDWSTGGTLPVEEHQQDNAKKRICLTSGPIVLAAEKRAYKGKHTFALVTGIRTKRKYKMPSGFCSGLQKNNIRIGPYSGRSRFL